MFQDINLTFIFVPALVIATIILVTVKGRRNKQVGSELSKAINHFKLTSIAFGALLVLLWLSLPNTSVLKTFGYPVGVTAIQGDAKLLSLLQEYNRAIVRTSEVLHWFLFLFT